MRWSGKEGHTHGTGFIVAGRILSTRKYQFRRLVPREENPTPRRHKSSSHTHDLYNGVYSARVEFVRFLFDVIIFRKRRYLISRFVDGGLSLQTTDDRWAKYDLSHSMYGYYATYVRSVRLESICDGIYVLRYRTIAFWFPYDMCTDEY